MPSASLWVIAEMKLHEIALTHADEQSGHLAAERPEKIIHAVGHALHHLAHFEVHMDFRRVLALDRRRHIRRDGEHGLFLADDFGIGALRLRPGKRGSAYSRRLRRECGRHERQAGDGDGEEAGDGHVWMVVRVPPA
jgi:hypothetical protein